MLCNWTRHDATAHGVRLCKRGHPRIERNLSPAGKCRACRALAQRQQRATDPDFAARERARARAYHAAHRVEIIARKRAKRTRPHRGPTPRYPLGGRPYAPSRAPGETTGGTGGRPVVGPQATAGAPGGAPATNCPYCVGLGCGECCNTGR